MAGGVSESALAKKHSHNDNGGKTHGEEAKACRNDPAKVSKNFTGLGVVFRRRALLAGNKAERSIMVILQGPRPGKSNESAGFTVSSWKT